MLLIALISYSTLLLLISFWAQRKIRDEEDYVVAGRKLSFGVTTATLLATWFGAGTLLTATDEIAAEGLRVVALEPVGAGLCLVVAGIWFAKPLWELKIFTLADFFKSRYGVRAEMLQIVTMLPSFVGWIAVQLTALAGIFNVLFGWEIPVTIVGIGLFALLYTWMGGMWSVSLTDAFQLSLMISGIAILAWHVVTDLSAVNGSIEGLKELWAKTTVERKQWIPLHQSRELAEWFGWLSVAMLGNLPSQDLAQRIFAAKSGQVAQRASCTAGVLYLVLGAVPVLLGMCFPVLFPQGDSSAVVIQMARHYFSDAMMIVFLLAVVSMVLSSMDSGILAPATVLGRNLFRKWAPDSISSLALCRWGVLMIAAISVGVALMGSGAFELLESSYSIGLVGFLVPLAFGLFSKLGNQTSALLSMGVGIGVWLVELLFGVEWPLAPLGAILALLVFYIHGRWFADSVPDS